MASDWEAGERQGDCKGELGPVERSETGTVANVFDCKARQTKERDCLWLEGWGKAGRLQRRIGPTTGPAGMR